jgi:hypothetical protein
MLFVIVICCNYEDLAGLVYYSQNKLIKHIAMLKNVPVVNESLKFIATFL